MIKHCLTIALRNLRKYKAQTVISVCAMAVSITLMAILTSYILTFSGSPLMSQPYADRVEILYSEDNDDSITADELNLLLGHQFESVEEIHYNSNDRYTVDATACPGQEEQRIMITSAGLCDPGFSNFYGCESTVSGHTAQPIEPDEVIITKWLADKLYMGNDAVGSRINLHFYYFDGKPLDKTYTVADVIDDPGELDQLYNSNLQINFYDEHIPATGRFTVLLLLRDGYSRQDLARELSEISDNKLSAVNVESRDRASQRDMLMVRNCIILFLFMFVCVSFSSYLRQELQLFRLREREVAIRTYCCGKPSSLFLLFAVEILITLLITLGIALLLDILLRSFMLQNYIDVLDWENWTMTGTVRISCIIVGVLAIISMIAVGACVRLIRRNQTGLAMRMKPMPKHRMRNVGITVQLMISLLFAWMVLILSFSIDFFKERYGIPSNMDHYYKHLMVRLNGTSDEQNTVVYDMIERLGSVERVFKFYSYDTTLRQGEEDDSGLPIITLNYQSGNDFVDFYNLKLNENKDYNPDRNILVSEGFKQYLTERGLWNGSVVNILGEDYQVRGTYGPIPFERPDQNKSVIITDRETNIDYYDRIIMPYDNMEVRARQDIDDILHQVFPSRIDVSAKQYYLALLDKYVIIRAMLSVLAILSGISIITTVATIYASVSLDTRRRRKEMALRKLNGAKADAIRYLFLRTYITILAVAALTILPIGIIIGMSMGDHFDNIWFLLGTYVLALALITAITALTIYWKIRQVMRVDPVQYLKE